MSQYFLLLEASNINIVFNLLKDYPIMGVNVVNITKTKLLPRFIYMETDLFEDEMESSLGIFLQQIGYYNDYILLRPTQSHFLSSLDDNFESEFYNEFDIIPPLTFNEKNEI
jgi:hypothetical protein